MLAALALPRYSLATVFVVALLSGTLLPLGSEPVVFGLITLNPAEFWPVILAATAGGTVGWRHHLADGLRRRACLARAARRTAAGSTGRWPGCSASARKPACSSWLPGVGDPLCGVAGWLRLPFWPCLLYMAVGKLARYVIFTALLLWVF